MAQSYESIVCSGADCPAPPVTTKIDSFSLQFAGSTKAKPTPFTGHSASLAIADSGQVSPQAHCSVYAVSINLLVDIPLLSTRGYFRFLVTLVDPWPTIVVDRSTLSWVACPWGEVSLPWTGNTACPCTWTGWANGTNPSSLLAITGVPIWGGCKTEYYTKPRSVFSSESTTTDALMVTQIEILSSTCNFAVQFLTTGLVRTHFLQAIPAHIIPGFPSPLSNKLTGPVDIAVIRTKRCASPILMALT